MHKTEARHISVSGVVQGVGFRPFVYNLAQRLGLGGWVLNNSGGVEIEIEGTVEALEAFLSVLRAEPPPLAHIASLTVHSLPLPGYTHFEIRHSEQQEGRYQLISPDVATCPDCLRELLDPADRRYRYPFINCTNCGPRFTIIGDIPYDRPNTTMRVFPMCPDCQREYDDPANRRFHAQPNACPVCGPHIWLTDATGLPLASDESHADNDKVLSQTRELILAGKILAIKGLGGFHLACDATDAEAVRTLRARKHRPHKPLAVMLPTLEAVKQHCLVSPAEETLLTSHQCPIVLLERRPGSAVVEEVAPRNRTLGVMIPYTPLHHILLRDVGRPLVMTSGNLSEEPIAQNNEEALRRLGALADAFLFHNRDIYSRYDDSVWHVVSLKREVDLAQPLRRARGYAPFPIALPFPMRPILATGAELKNTFCLARDEYAFLSQHIGDMENLETLEHFETTLALFRHLFRLEPDFIAHDLHPDYLATKFAIRNSQLAIPVQHHHAHVAACLADNSWGLDDGAVIGVALDGTGYGEDGTIWGGEWLVGGYRGFRRAAHLEYLPLPGGDAAIRQPWRIAAAYVYALLGGEAVPETLVSAAWSPMFYRQLERRINTPLTSSMGRLFDAVSALLGVCTEATYEAQGAIELEQISRPFDGTFPESYPFVLEESDEGCVLRLRPLLAALLEEVRAETPVPEVAWRFHGTVARMIERVCCRLRDKTGLQTVALSGGCFQNRLMTQLVVPLLEEAGFGVLLHRQLPCNDGGLSLGQAAIAHFRVATKE
jgi:hydrogenase maturation protein HypF